MKRIGKWLLGLITSALTLVLVIVLLPYAAKWVARIMPDESAAAIRASVVLSQKLEQSAKLETLHVTEEGALNYEVKAAFLGTVASINADYTYEGSFGIDLQQVTITRDGSVLTLTLPAPELLLDSLKLKLKQPPGPSGSQLYCDINCDTSMILPMAYGLIYAF